MMRYILVALGLLTQSSAYTFKTPTRFIIRPKISSATSLNSFDPTSLYDTLQSTSSYLGDIDIGVDGMTAADAVATATDAAAATTSNGWFGFLAAPIEQLLQIIHSGLDMVVPGQSWGLSILLLTVLIKVLTYPLSYTQIESTTKMQTLQPLIKETQSKYQSNPEVMNQKIAAIYQDNAVNPLAGCLPSLIQLPVFIGLYRSVLNLAKENKLDESFLWLPNLEGPTYGADPAHGSDWILKGWHDFTPSLGWEQTLPFLTIPVFLVISQSISQKLLQPPSSDPSQETSNAVLKFLPLLIGWFSLNVPAALGVYWVANNLVSTAITLQIKSQFKDAPAMATTGGSAGDPDVVTSSSDNLGARDFPTREKPVGFGGSESGRVGDGLEPLTAQVVDITEAGSGSPTQKKNNSNSNSNSKKKKNKN